MKKGDSVILCKGSPETKKPDDKQSFYCYSWTKKQSLQTYLQGENHLSIVWPESQGLPESQCSYDGIQRRVEVVQTGDHWVLLNLDFVHEGLKLLAYASDERQPPLALCSDQSYHHLLLLPLLGLLGQKWCDGICGHTHSGGVVSTMLAPAAAGSIKILPDFFSQALEGQAELKLESLMHHYASPEYLRQSLVVAINYQFKPSFENSFNVLVDSFDLKDAVGILLLRQAYLEAKVYLHSREEFKVWPKGWKHLVNCLGMEFKPEYDQAKAFSVKKLTEHLRGAMLQDLANHMNEPSQILAGIIR